MRRTPDTIPTPREYRDELRHRARYMQLAVDSHTRTGNATRVSWLNTRLACVLHEMHRTTDAIHPTT